MRTTLALAVAAALAAGLDIRPDYDALKSADDDTPPFPEVPRKMALRQPPKPLGVFTPSPRATPKQKSSSLERMLRRAR